MTIIISGADGSGKTTLAEMLNMKIASDIIPLAEPLVKTYKELTNVDFWGISREEKERHRPKIVQLANCIKEIVNRDVFVLKTMNKILESKLDHHIIPDIREKFEYDYFMAQGAVYICIGEPIDGCIPNYRFNRTNFSEILNQIIFTIETNETKD